MPKPTHVPGLDARSPLRQAAKLLLEARLLDVRLYEPELAEGRPPEKAVHGMRVALRRLRAALRLFRLRELDGPVKALQDALGAVRDLRLQIAWLAHRDAHLAAKRRALLPGAERALRRRLHIWQQRTVPLLQKAVQDLDLSGRLGGDKVRKVLRKHLRRLDDRLVAALKSLDPAPAHRLRISVKQVRYLAELVEDALPDFSKPLLKDLESLQEALGKLHDTDVRIQLLSREKNLKLLESENKRRSQQAHQLAAKLRRWSKHSPFRPSLHSLR
jgi:CHAD domain-containing protein